MKRQNLIIVFFAGFSLASLNGCGLSSLSHRDTNPNIQDQTYGTNPFKNLFGSTSVNTFATTASRRLVLVLQTKDKTGTKDKIFTCSEPSPDVAEAFASAIADGLKLAASDPRSGITAEISNQYARAVATQIAPLVYRTQGLQLYRDGIHDLCVDRLNGWVGEDGMEAKKYAERKNALLDAAIKLINSEIPVMGAAQTAFYEHVNAGIGLESLQKIADIVKSPTSSTTTTSTPTATTTTTTNPIATKPGPP